MAYKRFAIMMVWSFIIMYFVMFLNIDEIGHYHTCLTRIYMALMMVTPMAVVMILMMRSMYRNKTLNAATIGVAITLLVLTIFALRTQTPISDREYMKAMIPHHSSAIMVSKNADLKNPEVQKLARQIIKSQHEEIELMNKLLNDSV